MSSSPRSHDVFQAAMKSKDLLVDSIRHHFFPNRRIESLDSKTAEEEGDHDNQRRAERDKDVDVGGSIGLGRWCRSRALGRMRQRSVARVWKTCEAPLDEAFVRAAIKLEQVPVVALLLVKLTGIVGSIDGQGVSAYRHHRHVFLAQKIYRENGGGEPQRQVVHARPDDGRLFKFSARSTKVCHYAMIVIAVAKALMKQ